MTDDAVPIEPKPKRRKQFGRPGLVRLPGLDLRTIEGRAFRHHYRRLFAEFGPEHETIIRELAATRVAIEATQAEMLDRNVEGWVKARAREALPGLSRLATKLEARLSATKPAPAAEPAAPALAAILARHASPEAAE
ncbi:hypothetical protein [Methylocystis echinoides]|uniref:Uncharacterized protein n=1 Tax=Methylocystis echinoides TaxID=29468 RepID=A0A9W6GV46_9HYPH|nr:hypothetical protein [Methylocystis echinoides]GLI93602.1 hypothetical protein LMG27198_25940 [Methylocystis echinoides]